jgi:hypothetical protein
LELLSSPGTRGRLLAPAYTWVEGKKNYRDFFCSRLSSFFPGFSKETATPARRRLVAVLLIWIFIVRLEQNKSFPNSSSEMAEGMALASLWNVDDEATSELMGKFYESLLKRHQTPAQALRTAQKWMRGQPRWRPAYYWAGFVLLGEWN